MPNGEFGYTAASSGFAPAASATDVLAIGGKASSITRVKKIILTGKTTGTDPVIDVLVHKRTVADTTGDQVALTLVPHNSSFPAATCYVTAFTANPTVGNSTGLLFSGRTVLSTTAVFTVNPPLVIDFSDDPITLNSSAEQVCVNLNGVTVAGGALRPTVKLTQEFTP